MKKEGDRVRGTWSGKIGRNYGIRREREREREGIRSRVNMGCRKKETKLKR